MKNKNFSPLMKGQQQQINEAASILRKGGIVAFPTETVYGLGADATNLKAIRKVYEAKQRPLDHPVIVHLSAIGEFKEWTKHVSSLALDLINCFWPGPLTLVLPRADWVSDEIT